MGRFKGLGSTKPSGPTSKNIRDGRYLYLVRATEMVGEEKTFFCPMLTVVDAEDGSLDKVGDEVSVRWSLDGTNDRKMNMPKVKCYCMALEPETEEHEIDDDFGEELVGPDQPSRGILIMCHAVTKPQKKNPQKNFTHLNWSPAEESDYEEHSETIKRLLEA